MCYSLQIIGFSWQLRWMAAEARADRELSAECVCENAIVPLDCVDWTGSRREQRVHGQENLQFL